MSKFSFTPKTVRRMIISFLGLVAYLGLVVLVFNMGKGYYVYIDNNDSEDGLVLGIEGVSVGVDKQESAEYYPRDRDKFRLRGKKHTLYIEVLADGTKYEKKINVGGIGDNVLVSIPMLVAGKEPAIIVFKPPVYVAPTETFVPGTTDGSVNPEAQSSFAPPAP